MTVKVDIDEDTFDKLVVQYLKEYAARLHVEIPKLHHSEDIMNGIQTHAALLRVIEYLTIHSEFIEYVENQYASHRD